ncbi:MULTISPECIES: hypothetical protein [unclassified Streptomyces]|uniref:hypothetical protein n=1 Tax=unclassified Streptomyces TaxID=2593676 RepID=UPI00068F41C2|nr:MULTISPECIES: hypothetical protein [unclassified Streptomyces]
MNSTRRSYEANVLVVPLGADAVRTQEAFAGRGLDGVMTVHGVTEPAPAGHAAARLACAPLHRDGWRPPATGLGVDALVDGADMVVLLAADLAEVSPALCHAVADAARARGALIAALIVGSENWDTPRGNTAMAALREATDMLVVVRGVALAASFLDVLRGGAREPVAAP